MASSKSSSEASAQKVTKLSHMVQYADVELRNYDGEFLLATIVCWRGALCDLVGSFGVSLLAK